MRHNLKKKQDSCRPRLASLMEVEKVLGNTEVKPSWCASCNRSQSMWVLGFGKLFKIQTGESSIRNGHVSLQSRY